MALQATLQEATPPTESNGKIVSSEKKCLVFYKVRWYTIDQDVNPENTLAGRLRGVRSHRLGETEIDQHHCVVAAQHDVSWFQITMQNFPIVDVLNRQRKLNKPASEK